jgi:hypothetical protein
MDFYININGELCYSITNADGSTTSGLKSAYDLERTDTPTQSELDAIAKAESDATALATAEATAKATFAANLAATNAKLMALGLTATDIGTLLNAAKL